MLASCRGPLPRSSPRAGIPAIALAALAAVFVLSPARASEEDLEAIDSDSCVDCHQCAHLYPELLARAHSRVTLLVRMLHGEVRACGSVRCTPFPDVQSKHVRTTRAEVCRKKPERLYFCRSVVVVRNSRIAARV